MALALFLTSGAVAAPFETDGFRQGMSLSEVEREARLRGYELHKFPSDGSGTGYSSYNVLHRGHYRGLLTLQCGRLGIAGWMVDGDVNNFIKQLIQLEKEGYQRTDVQWRSDFWQGQERYKLSVYLVKAGNEKDYYVEVTLFSNDKHGVSNSQLSYLPKQDYCTRGE